MATIADVCEFILGCDNNDLQKVIAAIKSRSHIRNAKAAFVFNEGDKVFFKGRRGMILHGQVEKVNRTTITVKVLATGQVWRVSAAALAPEKTECGPSS